MLAFRAHVRRAGSRWAWEVRQGRGGASTLRTGTANTRAAAIRAAFRPAPVEALLLAPVEAPHPAALAA